jgi:hypothetical protein
LKQVPATSLYKATSPGPGENMLFLRWATDKPPGLIPLEETWAESGLPATSGYFLFLDAMPTDAKAFEQAMRKSLPPPTTSAFAWVAGTAAASGPTSPSLPDTVLKTKLDGSDRPVVDGDTQLGLLPGSEGVGFGDGAPILATGADGLIDGFVVTYPPPTGAQGPSPAGVALPMTGPCVGCVQFSGLTDSPGVPQSGDSARKSLVSVSIDPHHPFDQTRTYRRFTGAEYVLTQNGNSYSISPAP